MSCVVAGNQHETRRQEFGSQSSDADNAKRVVLDGLTRVPFHQRDPLVSRGMKDYPGLIGFEDVVHPWHINHIGHQGDNPAFMPGINQFLLDPEQIAFALINQQKTMRTKGRDLTAQFASHVAARSGDEDSVSRNDIANRIEL